MQWTQDLSDYIANIYFLINQQISDTPHFRIDDYAKLCSKEFSRIEKIEQEMDDASKSEGEVRVLAQEMLSLWKSIADAARVETERFTRNGFKPSPVDGGGICIRPIGYKGEYVEHKNITVHEALKMVREMLGAVEPPYSERNCVDLSMVGRGDHGSEPLQALNLEIFDSSSLVREVKVVDKDKSTYLDRKEMEVERMAAEPLLELEIEIQPDLVVERPSLVSLPQTQTSSEQVVVMDFDSEITTVFD